MKTTSTLFFLLLLSCVSNTSEALETITFNSKDGVEITADVYITHPDTAPFIVLFHQAGWSRGEYREIAPKLNQMGFNCMAIDQRSGNAVNGVSNETYKSAKQKMKETQYLDALVDMESAIDHARKYFAKGKLVIWGSSYSAALVLKIAGDQPELMDGALSFAPGEYYKSAGKPGDFIQTSAKNIHVPIFITSARSEKGNWWKIYESIKTDSKAHFIPETSGNHGSRALWNKFPDHKDYWKAVTDFLDQFNLD